MHRPLLSALLLLTAATARAQTRTVSSSASGVPAPRAFQHGESIVMGFDEASGYGTVDLQPMALEGATDLRLQALFKFKGRTLAEPPARVSLALHSLAPAARHAATKTVRLAPDGGAAVVLTVLFRQVDTTGARVRETLALSAPRASVARLAAAARVEGRAGDATFALGTAQLEALRDFLSRMAPAAHREAILAASGGGASPAGGQDVPARRPGVYAATEVTVRARQTGALVPPRYPVVPLAERRSRSVAVEFVVNAAGRVDTTTLVPRSVGDSLFARAVRAVAGDWRFAPARHEGRVVSQVVTLAIPFDPGKPLPEPIAIPAGNCTPDDLASFGGRAYHESQVTQMVVPAEGNRSPAFPSETRGSGRVMVQFVVDSTGTIVPCTYRVPETTGPELTKAVENAIATWRFEPALLHGIPVAQLVERTFTFVSR